MSYKIMYYLERPNPKFTLLINDMLVVIFHTELVMLVSFSSFTTIHWLYTTELPTRMQTALLNHKHITLQCIATQQ